MVKPEQDKATPIVSSPYAKAIVDESTGAIFSVLARPLSAEAKKKIQERYGVQIDSNDSQEAIVVVKEDDSR